MKCFKQFCRMVRNIFMSRGEFNTVRAKHFILEDENGNKKAELLVDRQNNVVLHFIDESGQSRLYLGITSEGTPRIGLTYGGGKGSIQIEANDKLNSSAIVFCGTEGKPQILLGIANTGIPAIGLYDKDGKLIFPQFDRVYNKSMSNFLSLFPGN